MGLHIYVLVSIIPYSFTKNLSVFRRDVYNSMKEVVPEPQSTSAASEMMV